MISDVTRNFRFSTLLELYHESVVLCFAAFVCTPAAPLLPGKFRLAFSVNADPRALVLPATFTFSSRMRLGLTFISTASATTYGVSARPATLLPIQEPSLFLHGQQVDSTRRKISQAKKSKKDKGLRNEVLKMPEMNRKWQAYWETIGVKLLRERLTASH